MPSDQDLASRVSDSKLAEISRLLTEKGLSPHDVGAAMAAVQGERVPLIGDAAAARDFVSDLYRLILRREADEGGLETYVGAMLNGSPVIEILRVFVESPEFTSSVQRKALQSLSAQLSAHRGGAAPADGADSDLSALTDPARLFPEDYRAPAEAGKSYQYRRKTGFLSKYCSGPLVLDIGYTGYDNPEKLTAMPHAIGVDLDYPGYDGITLPFDDGTVDTVFSSHCLEHILFDKAAIRDWFRVLRVGGFIVCMVPSQLLYEKRRFLPSHYNADHKRMYTISSLAADFEQALEPNSYRIRHLAENDRDFNYRLGPDSHSDGCYELEIVVEKIIPPDWSLA